MFMDFLGHELEFLWFVMVQKYHVHATAKSPPNVQGLLALDPVLFVAA